MRGQDETPDSHALSSENTGGLLKNSFSTSLRRHAPPSHENGHPGCNTHACLPFLHQLVAKQVAPRPPACSTSPCTLPCPPLTLRPRPTPTPHSTWIHVLPATLHHLCRSPSTLGSPQPQPIPRLLLSHQHAVSLHSAMASHGSLLRRRRAERHRWRNRHRRPPVLHLCEHLQHQQLHAAGGAAVGPHLPRAQRHLHIPLCGHVQRSKRCR